MRPAAEQVEHSQGRFALPQVVDRGFAQPRCVTREIEQVVDDLERHTEMTTVTSQGRLLRLVDARQ